MAEEDVTEMATVTPEEEMMNRLQKLEENFETLHNNTNIFFLVVMGMAVFFLQGGFALLEAGSVRSKHTVNILIKNTLDALIGGISYWAIGWGAAYGPGGNGFVGGSEYFAYYMDSGKYALWFFQFCFAATAATIISGAIAERCQFMAYFIYSFLITGWVYPVVSHWAWDPDGWLKQMGFVDFAGSSVVHLLGGSCSLIACYVIKPRHGRFDENGRPNDMPGHSIPLTALGVFILLFGFLAFNGGSQGAIATAGDEAAVSRAVVSTVLGGCGGGLSVIFVNRIFISEHWSYLLTMNGLLAGMVSQCSGCNVYQPWAAIVIGIIGGQVFLGVHFLMLKMRLDDPLDAVAVHFGGGLIGILAAPFFSTGTGIFWAGDTNEAWMVLGVNILGAFVIVCWSIFWSLLIFRPLEYFGIYRIDRETEFRGNDAVKHGEAAYPAAAWVEMQYQDKESLPMHMVGNSAGQDANGDAKHAGGGRNAKYNNPFEMLPTSGMLFRTVSDLAKITPATSMASPPKESKDGDAAKARRIFGPADSIEEMEEGNKTGEENKAYRED